jgi:hypothetical protein
MSKDQILDVMARVLGLSMKVGWLLDRHVAIESLRQRDGRCLPQERVDRLGALVARICEDFDRLEALYRRA